MRSAARAIAWEFGLRHRWGLLAVAAYLGFLIISRLALGADAGVPVDLSEPAPDISERFAFTIIVPGTMALLFLLAVFSHGLSGDLAGRESLYPARMFTLPVSTTALAAWPMLFGTLAMLVLWLCTALFGIRPTGLDVSLVWPALFIVAFLLWTQALMWMPYGLRFIRVFAAVLLLGIVDTTMVLAMYQRASDGLMIAILAPQLPVAFMVARHALVKSRRGDVPDWRGVFARAADLMDVLPRRRHPFASAARAQAWFEWRQHGLALPLWVAILVPFVLALLFIGDAVHPKLAFYTLVTVLITPPVMAAFSGTRVSRSATARDAYGVSPFTATRPLTNSALVAAKLEMALWSTLAAWLVVAIAIPVALTWANAWPVVTEPLRRFVTTVGNARALVLTLLIVLALMASTWKRLVQSLYIGLTGRDWFIKATTIWMACVVTMIVPLGIWIHDNRSVRLALWNALPWMLAVLVGVKMIAAAWVVMRLIRTRTMSDRAILAGAAGWMIIVLVLHASLVWLIATPFIPPHLLLLVAILFVPLARVAAAPLALAWNRHR